MAIEIRLPLSGSCWETVLELCGSCALSYNGLHYTRHYTRGKRGYLRLRYFDFFPGRNPVTPISRRFLVGRLVSKLLVRFRRPNYRPWCYIQYRESIG